MINEVLKTVPPWIQHFFTHVIKRQAGILIKWIDDMNEVNKDE